MLLVTDVGKDSWKGVTAFRPRDEGVLEDQRHGVLAWRRTEKGPSDEPGP